jgi:hypothetical protein
VASPGRSLGRNDPCHCGSGRKYKQCCLEKDEAAAREERAKAAAAEAAAPESAPAKAPPPAPRHNTRQPWKGRQNTRGFAKANLPRRSGGS